MNKTDLTNHDREGESHILHLTDPLPPFSYFRKYETPARTVHCVARNGQTGFYIPYPPESLFRLVENLIGQIVWSAHLPVRTSRANLEFELAEFFVLERMPPCIVQICFVQQRLAMLSCHCQFVQGIRQMAIGRVKPDRLPTSTIPRATRVTMIDG